MNQQDALIGHREGDHTANFVIIGVLRRILPPSFSQCDIIKGSEINLIYLPKLENIPDPELTRFTQSALRPKRPNRKKARPGNQ